jgi:hypothetical protein
LRLIFKTQRDKISYHSFFKYLQETLKLELADWEIDQLENRLDRFGMAFINFNEFNQFCLEYDISWEEELQAVSLDSALEAKLSTNFKDYKLKKSDYFKGIETILTSEIAALAKADKIYE